MCKRSRLLVLLGLAVVAGWSLPVWGQAVSEQMKAQNKLLAERAARVDAMRKLAERIYGLMITSDTSVRDFVAESDNIRTEMEAFLRGAREVGRPRHMEDGTCEVTMEVTVQELIVTMKRLHTKYYKGSKVRAQDIDKIAVQLKEKTIRETGSGVPRPELIEDEMVEIGSESLDSFTYLRGAAKDYWVAHVTGRGRLMAVRAARVDGLRRLGERIEGVMITSETSVRDFVAESDQIRTELRAFIRGAREVGIRYHADELIVEVDMQVTLQDLIINLKKWRQEYYKGNKISVNDIEQISARISERNIRETGMGVPPEAYLKDIAAGDKAVLALGAKAPPWVGQKRRAVGNAVLDSEREAAQAKLMAQRAAELDARRKLAEEINGLFITSNTSVSDFVAMNDDIRTSMLTYQQFAKVVEGSQKFLPDGTCQVTVELELKPLWNMVLFYQKKLSLRIR